MDPSTEHHYAYIPKSEFIARWHDVEGADNVHIYHMLVLVKVRCRRATSHSFTLL